MGTRYTSRSYAGGHDLPLLIAFAQRQAAASRTRAPYYHPGDLVWQLYAFEASEDMRLWFDGDDVVACAIFEPPLNFQFDVDSARDNARELTEAAIAWAQGRRQDARTDETIPIAYEMLGQDVLATSVMDDDGERIRLLEARGYSQVDRGSTRFERELTAAPEARLQQGAAVRHVRDDELEDRAELHRDAWSVWGKSTFSVDTYRKLRVAPVYDRELDLVVECESRLVSYCICWLDTVNGVGYFEPVGTRPTSTGRGFGRAVLLEGFRRMRERGMRVATVGTASVNPAAQALYASAGFHVVAHEHFYVKPM